MKRYLLFALFLACLFGVSSQSYAVPGDVLDSLATPGSAPTGLTFDGSRLWVADRLTDTLYAVDPASGQVTATLPAPGFIPRGLAWDGSSLWCIDAEEDAILQMDVKTGVTLKRIDAPTPSPQGLAWDGTYLWLSDDRSDEIMQISTEDGTTIRSFPAPMRVSTGLTWWKGYLWCADRIENRIYLVDPKHGGEVVFSVDAPAPYARGLATDGSVLYNVDYQNDHIYKIVIDDGKVVKRSDEHTMHLLLTYEFRNYGPGEVPSLDAYIAMPHDMPSQKLLKPVSFVPAPLDTLTDQWDQPVAHFHLADPPLAQRERMTMEATVELAAARWFVFPEKVGSLKDIPKDVKKYLGDEDKYRIHDPLIQKAVKEAVGDETNPYWIMRDIHRYIRERLHYELAGGWNVAPEVLARGSGSCSEYTFLFISMCRAAGVPARYVGSVVIRGDEASTDDVFHRWSQVYLPGYGWIHVDPQGGDKEEPGRVAESIGNLSNRFLITTVGGGASTYLGWNYDYNSAWTGKGPVKIHEEAIGEWSPVSATAKGTGDMGLMKQGEGPKTGDACGIGQ